MARNAAQSGMSTPLRAAGLAFAPATIADAEDIAAILRDNPLGGKFRITMERGDNPFAADFGLSDNHVIMLARDPAGIAVGMCERVVYRCYVDGEVVRLPYLGGLRVNASHRNRIGAVRAGFQALREFERVGEADFALTSITADNDKAVRLLTAGLPGLPRYEAAGEYSTFVLGVGTSLLSSLGQRPRQRKGWGSKPSATSIRPATAADLPAIAALLNRENARFDFAPVWSAADLANLGRHSLEPQHFLIAGEAPRLTGCIAVWDQTAAKQTVMRGYPQLVSRFRRLINLASPLTGMPRLPRVGEALRQVVLSHVAVVDDDPALFDFLLDAALAQASARGFDSAILGMASERGLAGRARRRRTIEYRTVLYRVSWPNPSENGEPVTRLPNPELGLL